MLIPAAETSLLQFHDDRLDSYNCGGRRAGNNVTRCPSEHTYFGGPLYGLSFALARRVAASAYAAALRAPWAVEDVGTGRMVHRVAPEVFEQTEARYGLYAVNRHAPPSRARTFRHFKREKGRAAEALLCEDEEHAALKNVP